MAFERVCHLRQMGICLGEPGKGTSSGQPNAAPRCLCRLVLRFGSFFGAKREVEGLREFIGGCQSQAAFGIQESLHGVHRDTRLLRRRIRCKITLSNRFTEPLLMGSRCARLFFRITAILPGNKSRCPRLLSLATDVPTRRIRQSAHVLGSLDAGGQLCASTEAEGSQRNGRGGRTDSRAAAHLVIGQLIASRTLDQPNSRVIGLPAAIGRGRPSVSVTSVAGSMPRAQNMVAAMSSGVTGSVAG